MIETPLYYLSMFIEKSYKNILKLKCKIKKSW